MVFKNIFRTLCFSHPHFDSKFIKNIASLSKKERFELLSKDYAIKRPKNPLQQEKKVCEIWLGMNLKDIAKVAEKNLNEVKDALTYVNGAEKLSLKDNINDPKLLNQIFKVFGCKTVLAQRNITNVMSNILTKDFVRKPLPKKEYLKRRCPIVVIMGHVDHGKTTLLDQIRKTSMVDKEFGGITQHIGAFSVRLNQGQPWGSGERSDAITFLDTPGHAAFSAMRSRGAQVTDLAILVVGADDGVMDQTVESIKFAQEARVPIVVAINKIDKEKIDVERVQKQLLGHGVCAEEYGGEVQAIPISALKGQNIDGLLEALMAQAEVMDITADYTGPVEGVVIESRLDKNRGILSTVLIQRGTLKKGNILISLDENLPQKSPCDCGDAHSPQFHQSSANQASATWCKVRAMFDDLGRAVTQVMPGYPVEVIGWKGVPNVGTPIYQVESEERAREIVHYRVDIEKADKLEQDWKVIEEERKKHLINYDRDVKVKKALNYSKLPKALSAQHNPKLSLTESTDTGGPPQNPRLSIVVKGDVIGSIEAILDLLATYDESMNACHLDVLHYAVGPVTPFDVELAQTFKGIIYAFNVEDSMVGPSRNVVTIKRHNVIYKLIDDLISEMTNKLAPVEVEEILGEAGVNQEFLVSEAKAKIPVAGCTVDVGTFSKKCSEVHVMRGDRLIHKGSIKSLKHFKSDVESVKKGSECGVVLEDLTVRYKPGDVIRAISLKKMPGKIVWNLGF